MNIQDSISFKQQRANNNNGTQAPNASYKFVPQTDTFEKAAEIPTKATLKNDEIYAKLAQDCTVGIGKKEISGFETLERIFNKQNGFSGCVYKNAKTGEIVIAYSATKNQGGIKSILQMLGDKVPEQFDDADKLYKQIKKQFPDSKITITGHSLGGSLAQLVSTANPETKAITFESFGTGRIIKENLGLLGNGKANCKNYTTEGSFISSMWPQPGKTTRISGFFKKNADGESILKRIKKNKHEIFNFTDNLDTAGIIRKNSDGFFTGIKNFFKTKFANHVKTILDKLPIVTKKLPKLIFRR